MTSNNRPASEPLTDRLRAEEVEMWIRQAHGGCAQSLGQLYERCRSYLLLIANQELDKEMRAKLGPSDIVQDTLVKAQRNFDRFTGESDGELRAWLRHILLNNVIETSRRFKAGGKRDLSRERQFESLFAESPSRTRLVARDETPSKQASANEESALLMAALTRLPEHYREVIVLRNIERLPFADVGLAMGRTADASRKLWLRAIELLRDALET